MSLKVTKPCHNRDYWIKTKKSPSPGLLTSQRQPLPLSFLLQRAPGSWSIDSLYSRLQWPLHSVTSHERQIDKWNSSSLDICCGKFYLSKNLCRFLYIMLTRFVQIWALFSTIALARELGVHLFILPVILHITLQNVPPFPILVLKPTASHLLCHSQLLPSTISSRCPAHPGLLSIPSPSHFQAFPKIHRWNLNTSNS